MILATATAVAAAASSITTTADAVVTQLASNSKELLVRVTVFFPGLHTCKVDELSRDKLLAAL